MHLRGPIQPCFICTKMIHRLDGLDMHGNNMLDGAEGHMFCGHRCVVFFHHLGELPPNIREARLNAARKSKLYPSPKYAVAHDEDAE